MTNFLAQCDSLATGYTITFEVSGGDTSTYQITGSVNGTLIPGNPYVFISDMIPQGNSYQFHIDDVNGCDPTDLTGSFACSCFSQSGLMDTSLIVACEGDTITVPPAIGLSLDPDDLLIYILHHGNSNVLEDIVTSSATGAFVFEPPLQTGVIYYVSAVVGNPGGPYGVDLSDPCLSVSVGTPVMWVARPSGYISGPGFVCAGDDVSLNFTLSGGGPFSVHFSDGVNDTQVDSVDNGYQLDVSPLVTTTYTLEFIADLSGPGCTADMDTGITVTVGPNQFEQVGITICEGDSVFAGGAMQGDPGIYLDTLQTTLGCDSIVETTIAVNPVTTTMVSATSCDTSQVGNFMFTYSDQHGCDSIVLLTVSYAIADTTYTTDITCDENQAGTTVYTLQSQDGCDSIVIETLTWIQPDTTELFGDTCDASAAGVFVEMFTNHAGCDSMVITTINLSQSWTIDQYAETCDPDSAGVFNHQYFTQLGCDSVVVQTVTLLPSDTSYAQQVTCATEDTGSQVLMFTNVYGCDSVVFLTTTLAPEEVCNPVQVNRNIYVPNVFSPNNDGVNDVLVIFADPEFVRIPSLEIFDRWGELVVEKHDIVPGSVDSGWDGSFADRQLDPGVFVWKMEIEYSDGISETLYGDVTLVR